MCILVKNVFKKHTISMKWSLSLGKIAGIKIQIHWTFILIILWIIFLNLSRGSTVQETTTAVIFILTIFACVVLHELGHSLMAKRYGVAVKSITLLPIGGVASLEEIPEDPKKELLIAIAGPSVNLIIAGILFLILWAGGRLTIPAGAESFQKLAESSFLYRLLSVNLFLLVFNIIPAFPMDGGRVLRALLSLKMDRVTATSIAASIGQILAIGFAFLGLLSNPFLIVIALFVYLGAQFEAQQVRTGSILADHKVRDVLMHHYTPLNEHETLAKAIDILLDGQEREFVVLDDEDKAVGILTRDNIIKALNERGKEVSISEVMNRDFFSPSPTDSLKDVFQKMQQQRFTVLPVIEEDTLKGIIDMENILEFIQVQEVLQREVPHLKRII